MHVIGKDSGLSKAILLAERASKVDSTILLQGETGVGKDVLANYIHLHSKRRENNFVKINCGAIPDSLIDSELFGFEKGAFTGAVNSRIGKFEEASGGTIFLDEIAELSLSSQVRLLRVLQNREVQRIGGTGVKKLDIRVIAATHQNLYKQVTGGFFREDLYYRLNIFRIEVPPLRARREDIPVLIEYFLRKKSRELNISNVRPSEDFIRKLSQHEWPGNIRELENTVERLLITESESEALDGIFSPREETIEIEASLSGIQYQETLDVVVCRHIKNTLIRTRGKINGEDGAAELLGINPNTLRSKMKKLGIVLKKEFGSVNF